MNNQPKFESIKKSLGQLLAFFRMFGGGIDTAEDELMAQALGADVGEDDDSGEEDAGNGGAAAPRDGMAYLRNVMREAKRERQVVVAPNATALTAVRPRDHVYTGR